MLRRLLVPADFARLRVYAPLVKVIAQPSDISITDVLSPSIWSSFRKHGIGSVFNLHFVHYVSLSTVTLDETQQLADPIHNFIGPSLVKFHLTLQGGKDYDDLIQDPEGLLEAKPDLVLLDILAHLSSHCPLLRNFELETTPFPFYAADALSDAVCRWSHLLSFAAYTFPLRPNALKHLAALPSLRLLNAFVDLPAAVLKDVLLPDPEGPLVFSALRELTLHAKRLETCTRLIEIIESTTLAKISLYAYDHACPEDIESVCAALATHVSHNAIQELLIKLGCTIHDPPSSSSSSSRPSPEPPTAPVGPVRPGRAPPHPHEPLPQTVLAPLLSLGSLQKLSLLGPCFSALHDATLAAMAHAFPKLRAAALCPDADAAHPRVTLAGLGALARLEGLRSIRVPLADVDERAVADAFMFIRQSMPSPSRVSSTRLGSSEPGLTPTPTSAPAPDPADSQGSTSDLRCLAVDLDSEEPVLRAMGFRGGEDALEVKRRWQEVGGLVCSFAFVREQERWWAADHRAPT